MNLLIDSGNSFIKWAWAAENEFVESGRCVSSSVSSLFEKWEQYEPPDRVIIANVAGQSIAGRLSEAVKSLWALDAEFPVSPRVCCGLTNSYRQAEKLGIDRWLAMVAAYQITGNSVIVVDCGTAVTIDLVDVKGLFVGGVIMPGLMTALQSLELGTDAIVIINRLNGAVNPVPKSTENGVYAGVLLGLAGGIERVVREQALLVGEVPTVLISGGDKEKLIPHLTIPVVLQPDLVLQGLRIMATQRTGIRHPRQKI